jgi:undecaprenyl-diphosphatase
MSLIEALIIGLVQGLTEFLPVSSSAHLKLAKLFFRIQETEVGVAFDLVCHLGTLLALLYFLKQDILQLFRSERKKLLLLFIATLPLIPCYFLLKPLREYASTAPCLGLCLIATALMLFLGHKWRIRKEPPATLKKNVKDVLWIGAMQSAALIPGISRSASTISCAKVLGWSPKEAVRFSFLLSIPTIIGGNCLELLHLLLSRESLTAAPLSTYVVGFIASFGCGLFIIRFALSYLEKGNLKPFAWYCLGCGALVSVYLNFFARGI